MMIRLFHARVRPGKQAEFKKVLEVLSLPGMQNRNGMVAFYPGQPVGPDSNEFVLVTVWNDLAAAARRTHEEWVKTIIPEESLCLLEELRMAGYKAFGVSDQAGKPMFQNI